MSIDIHRIALLARLKIDDDKAYAFAEEMGKTVKMAEHFPELEKEKTLTDAENTMELRPDEVQPSCPQEAILGNAPRVADGCFLVLPQA